MHVASLSQTMSDDDNALGGDCDSITDLSEAGRSISASLCRTKKSKSGYVFKAWQFLRMIKASTRKRSTAVCAGD